MFNDMSVSRRCGARCRQTGLPCTRWASPFQRRCPLHGANRASEREKARKALQEYLTWSTDPAWRKADRASKFEISQRRWEMRRAKRQGPQAVAALKAEWEFEKTQKRQWAEDNERVRREQREKWKREHPDGYKGRKRKPEPPRNDDDNGPGFIPWNGQTDDWGL